MCKIIGIVHQFILYCPITLDPWRNIVLLFKGISFLDVNHVLYSGSAQHLKNRFGSGYTLTVRCQETTINQVFILLSFCLSYHSIYLSNLYIGCYMSRNFYRSDICIYFCSYDHSIYLSIYLFIRKFTLTVRYQESIIKDVFIYSISICLSVLID